MKKKIHVFNIDSRIENADWVKSNSWDMPDIRTEEELIIYLESTGKNFEDFKRLPAYQGFLKFLKKVKT